MIKKQQNDKGRRKLRDNKRKRIYLVYNVFKAWGMQKSRRDVTVGIAVISPHICCLLNTEEGKNNAILQSMCFITFNRTESTRNS